MKDGFPLLTTKMPFKTIFHRITMVPKMTNIKPLLDVKCNIWNGDAYKYYLKDSDNHAIKWLYTKGWV
jgi:thymidylate synthase